MKNTKLKLKENVKEKIVLGSIFVLIIIGAFLISARAEVSNNWLEEQKKTEMPITLSQLQK